MSSRVRWSRLSVVACATALIVPLAAPQLAAGDAPPPVPSAAATVGHPCNRQAVTSCLLPYPSNQFMVRDRTAATGYRLDVPPDILSADVLGQFGPGVSTDVAYGSADGFSVLTPVIFELPDAADPDSLPEDGGDVVRVVDLDTGERVPIRVEISADAARLGAEHRVLMAWPQDRYQYASRYLAVVTDQLKTSAGVSIRPAPGIQPLTALSRADRVRVNRLALQSHATQPDIDWAHVISATSFVTRSEANASGSVDEMASIVRAEDHPIRNLVVNAPTIYGGAQLLTGQVSVTDFRDADGVIPQTGPFTHSPHWIDFIMTLPDHPVTGAGAPVVIYGHGISVTKETMLTVSSINAAKGLATAAIDIPNHGSRNGEGGYLLQIANPHDFGRLASMPLQGELDNLSLLMAITSHFSTIDTFPHDWWTTTYGDGVPDLDTSHVLYEGTSMGGFLGAEFAALAPEIDGAFVQVAGTGIIDTLFHSLLWPLFTGVEPFGATPGDAHALVATAGQLLDRGDNVYFLDRLRAQGTPFYLVYADDDGVVPNTSSERMIRQLGLPIVGTQYHSVPRTTALDAMPANGTGATQIPTDYLDSNFAQPLLTHVSFADPLPTALLGQWLDQRIVAMQPAG